MKACHCKDYNHAMRAWSCDYCSANDASAKQRNAWTPAPKLGAVTGGHTCTGESLQQYLGLGCTGGMPAQALTVKQGPGDARAGALAPAAALRAKPKLPKGVATRVSSVERRGRHLDSMDGAWRQGGSVSPDQATEELESDPRCCSPPCIPHAARTRTHKNMATPCQSASTALKMC